MVRLHLHFNTLHYLDVRGRVQEERSYDDDDQWDRMISWLESPRGVKTHTILRGARDLTPRLPRPGSHWLTGWFLTPQHTGSGPLIGCPPGTSHLYIIIILLVCSEVQSDIRIFLVLAIPSVRQSFRHSLSPQSVMICNILLNCTTFIFCTSVRSINIFEYICTQIYFANRDTFLTL